MWRVELLRSLGAVLAHVEVCHNALVEFTGKETFEASNDLALGPVISGAAYDVGDGRLVELHPDDDGSIEGGVGLAVAAPIQPCRPVVIPEEAGIGHAPQSFAQAASERMRVGLSPERINNSAAVDAEAGAAVNDLLRPHDNLGRVPPLTFLRGRLRSVGSNPARIYLETLTGLSALGHAADVDPCRNYP